MKLKIFRWHGYNRLQQKQQGMIIAETEMQAQQELLSRGLQQLKLQRDWQISGKPNNAEICDLLMQFSTLLQSSVPLKNSLQILLQNCTNIALNRWLRKLSADIESGLSLSQSLENQGLYLSLQECQLLKVGEMTGKLAQVCSQIAKHRQQHLALQRKMQKILLYPALVLAVSLILTLLLLLFIVPQFAEMYAHNQAELPLFTAVLLTVSDTLQQYLWQFLLLAVLLCLLFRTQSKHSLRLNKGKSRLIAATPIFGGIVRLSRLVGFCRSLQLMLQSGIPLNQALLSFLPQVKSWQTNITLQGDLVLFHEVQSMLHWIQQGYTLSDSVGSGLFPLQAQQMLQVGEKSGQLAMMLQHIADNYQQQLDHKIDLLSQMLEPMLMLIIGTIIGLIMLGMYLPIFNMGAMIQ